MGDSGGGSETQQQSSSFIPIQKEVLTEFLESERGRIGEGQPIFPGLRVAPFSELQETALSLAPENLFRTAGAEQELFEKGIEAPAQRRFSQETVPLLREEFAGPGFFSSARAQETVRAGEDLASNLEAERQNLRRETEAINRQGVASLFDFGAAQQAQEQQVINAEIQKFIEETRLTNPEDAQILTALLGLNFSTSSSSTSPVGRGSGARTGAIIGGIAGGLTGVGAIPGGAAGAQIGGLF